MTLRDALYSAPFREYLSDVTGAGPLSGEKTDMAVNVYTPGCHLLCHDDVIGTRRVSYILYLTDPERPWKAEWGGALRLYSTKVVEGRDGKAVKVPWYEHSVAIPPAFNQLSFFAVQPGESFHDVEEVYARNATPKSNGAVNGDSEGKRLEDEDDGGRIRTAISGWYHIPQSGEPNYDASDPALQEPSTTSSLSQLQSQADIHDQPRLQWHKADPDTDGKTEIDGEPSNADVELTEADLNFLLHFLNPRYLVPDTVSELVSQFATDSSLRLTLFLSEKFAARLRQHISSQEANPQATHSPDWNLSRPPHKHRYLFQQPSRLAPSPSSNPEVDGEDPIVLLHSTLLPSFPFQKWLSLATGLTLNTCATLARRFRRGKDYTLATSYDEPDPRVEVCLGVTPTPGWSGDVEVEDTAAGSGEGGDSGAPLHSNAQGTEPGVGGYEAYMAGDDPPAKTPSSHTGAGNRPSHNHISSTHDPAVYQSNADDDEDDGGILFTQPASWNTLSVVLRDQGTLRFVKYVSKSARGDRWDVCGWWGVEPGSEGDEDESEDVGGGGDEDEDDYEDDDEAGEGEGEDDDQDDE